MKKIAPIVLVLLLLTVYGNAQIVRPFTQRYYNASVKGNIVYVSNSIISTSGIGTGDPGTGELPPAGSSRDNNGTGINIDIDNLNTTVKLPYGSVWNYHAQNAAPADNPILVNWKQPLYIMPATWNVGASPVNGPGKYGFNSGQTTCLPSGCTPVCTPANGCAKYTAYYFRNTVNFTLTELLSTNPG